MKVTLFNQTSSVATESAGMISGGRAPWGGINLSDYKLLPSRDPEHLVSRGVCIQLYRKRANETRSEGMIRRGLRHHKKYIPPR